MRLRKATGFWGADEEAIYRATEEAAIADVIAVAKDFMFATKIEKKLDPKEANRWRGILARRLHFEGNEPTTAFMMCNGANRRERLAAIGDVDQQRKFLDAVIVQGTLQSFVEEAFALYWEVEVTKVEGAKGWSLEILRRIHEHMKLLPDQHTRAGVWVVRRRRRQARCP